jgi:hypothetical protein
VQNLLHYTQSCLKQAEMMPTIPQQPTATLTALSNSIHEHTDHQLQQRWVQAVPNATDCQKPQLQSPQRSLEPQHATALSVKGTLWDAIICCSLLAPHAMLLLLLLLEITPQLCPDDPR